MRPRLARKTPARARLCGSARRVDGTPRALEAELETLLADQEMAQQRLQAEQSVLSTCKLWLDRLSADTKLEPVAVTTVGTILLASPR